MLRFNWKSVIMDIYSFGRFYLYQEQIISVKDMLPCFIDEKNIIYLRTINVWIIRSGGVGAIRRSTGNHVVASFSFYFFSPPPLYLALALMEPRSGYIMQLGPPIHRPTPRQSWKSILDSQQTWKSGSFNVVRCPHPNCYPHHSYIIVRCPHPNCSSRRYVRCPHPSNVRFFLCSLNI